ncbi:MAG: biotin-dependent carboxyltransferase, partial [Halomonadaceae bacterium]
ADEKAFLWANRLLGNPSNSPGVEIALGGLQLEARVSTRIALTGADLQASLNGQPLSPWQTARLNPGDRLHFGYARSGLRGYLAVQGGLRVTPVLGSTATVMREHLGGLDGQGSKLQTGDWLPCDTRPEQMHRRVLADYIPDYRQPLTLRVIAGHQHGQFHKTALDTFYGSRYRIGAQSDRMGVRLQGEPVPAQTASMLSEGISFGAIQVPPDGQPIILLKDRQTIGGYPKLGTLHPLDAFALAQIPPNSEVGFKAITLKAAQQQMRTFYGFLLERPWPR